MPSFAASGRRLPLLLGLAALAALVLAVLHLGEGEQFVLVARSARPAWLLLALVLQAATYLTDAAVSRAVLAASGERRPFQRLYALSIVALFTSQTVPSAGLAGNWVVVRGLRGWGVPPSVAMAVILVDIIGYYAAYGLFVGLALAVLSEHHHLSRVVLGMAAGLVVVALALASAALWLTGPARPAGDALARWPALSAALAELSAADPALVRSPRLLAAAFVLRGANFAIDAATVWACLAAVGVDTGAGPPLVGLITGSLARTLGVVPGGLGTFEAAMVGGLALFGIRVEAALTATLLYRGLAFWLPLPLGLAMARTVAGPSR